MRPSRIIKPGKRIGHLHVLSHILDGSGKGSWECECDCGRIITRTTESLLAAISRGNVSGCGRGCGMRKTTAPRDPIPEPENDPSNNPDIDWDAFITDYHELIDRYRADSSSEEAS
ncbi:hypothetical protein [Bifidobacterium pseudolongum]|uniref:hypothetical protein n=1 Tax=Bifidobacterium pseudolongum TaxID=1694 RepID=UPI001021F8F8|nr:hypothetical protein [Bifidobacterium pseudolongum]RYQ56940.1 hypothetical protein PG1616B_1021 [Bifidobacterium pseudolongum subsp. globosum]